MKKLILISLLFCACKKDKTEYTTLEMKDVESGVLLKQGTVEFFKCTTSDPFCGWIAWQTAFTDDAGRCKISVDDYARVTYMRSYKDKYWAQWEPRVSTIWLVPEGWIRLRIIRGTGYPASSTLRINIISVNSNKSTGGDFKPAADSTILFRSFGAQLNRINWIVSGPGGTQLNSGTWDQLVPRHDTVSASLTY